MLGLPLQDSLQQGWTYTCFAIFNAYSQVMWKQLVWPIFKRLQTLNGPNIIKYHQISRGNLGQEKQIQSVRWMLANRPFNCSLYESLFMHPITQLKLSLGVQAPTTLPVPAPTHGDGAKLFWLHIIQPGDLSFWNAILPSLLLFGQLFQCDNKLSERPGFWLSFCSSGHFQLL